MSPHHSENPDQYQDPRSQGQNTQATGSPGGQQGPPEQFGAQQPPQQGGSGQHRSSQGIQSAGQQGPQQGRGQQGSQQGRSQQETQQGRGQQGSQRGRSQQETQRGRSQQGIQQGRGQQGGGQQGQQSSGRMSPQSSQGQQPPQTPAQQPPQQTLSRQQAQQSPTQQRPQHTGMQQGSQGTGTQQPPQQGMAPQGMAQQRQGPPGQAGMGMQPPRLQSASIEQIVETDVAAVEPDASISDVAEKMAAENVGSVLITEDQEPAGIITDRSLALALESSPDLSDATASEFRSSDLITGTLEMTVFEVIDRMEEEGIRRLPIVDEEGELAGIVTLDDVLVLLNAEMANVTSVVESQSPRF